MLPGPTKVRKCPSCGQLLKQRTISSGNTVGARYWTDGVMNARMLPRTPAIVKCPHCAEVSWLADFEEVDSYRTYLAFLIFEEDQDKRETIRKEEHDKRDAYESVPYYDQPNCHELCLFAENGGLDASQESSVRIRAWRVGNDARRYSDSPSALTDVEVQNLLRLLVLLESDQSSTAIVKAEMNRELGLLDAAKKIIENSPMGTDEEEDLAQFILELIQNEDTQVCEVSNDDSRLWRAIRRRNRKNAQGNVLEHFDPSGPQGLCTRLS